MARHTRAQWPDLLVALYSERRTDLVRIAYLMTGSASVAEELVHDAFVSSLPHVQAMTSPYGYVRAAVVNNARSWHRRQEVEQRMRPAPAEPVLLQADEMWDALQVLDERRRAAIVLRFYEALPDPEIAEILECEVGTVRTLVHRGLRDLRREIEQ